MSAGVTTGVTALGTPCCSNAPPQPSVVLSVNVEPVMVVVPVSEKTLMAPPSPPVSWLSVKVELVIERLPDVAIPPPLHDAVLPVKVAPSSTTVLSASSNRPPPQPSTSPPVMVTSFRVSADDVSSTRWFGQVCSMVAPLPSMVTDATIAMSPPLTVQSVSE